MAEWLCTPEYLLNLEAHATCIKNSECVTNLTVQQESEFKVFRCFDIVSGLTWDIYEVHTFCPALHRPLMSMTASPGLIITTR